MKKINEYLNKSNLLEDKNKIEFFKKWYYLTDETIEFLKRIKTEIDSTGIEWEFQFKFSSVSGKLKLNTYVVLYYDKITITNSSKQTHDITEMYVSFKLLHSNIVDIDYFSGTRSKLTNDEYFSRYCHSHLNSLRRIGYSSFCTGTGAINQLMMIMSSELKNDVKLISMFVHEIKAFLSWESIEGVPYKYISNIKNSINGELSNLDPYHLRRELINFEKFYNDNKAVFEGVDFTIDVTKGRIIMNNVDLFFEENELMKRYLTSFLPYSHSCYKDVNGNYFTSGIIKGFPKNTNHYILFKGKKVYLKGNDTVVLKNDGERRYFHPQIKKLLKEKIEYELTKKAIKLNSFR